MILSEVCEICEKENQHKHQDFCGDICCGGKMVLKKYKSSDIALAERDFHKGGRLYKPQQEINVKLKEIIKKIEDENNLMDFEK